MRTIAIGNQKGGVGKTTTALNLGYSLVDRGRRVLLVDLDPQASLTISAGVSEAEGASMAEVLTDRLTLAEIIRPVTDRLALAPSDIALSEAEIILISRLGREYYVKRALAGVAREYDYAILDLPPSLGLLTINGLAAAESVLIPAIPQYLDMRALAIFTRTIEKVKLEINPDLYILGVLPTFFDGRFKLHAEVLEAWRLGGLPLFDYQVKRSVRVAESPIAGQPVSAFSATHADVYYRLAEVIDHG